MKIYVGNLSYDATEEDLTQEFGAFGEVTSINIIKDRETGRPKGFAFVEMAKQGDGDNAIKELNDKEVKGRKMRVSVARPPNKDNAGPRRFKKY